MNCGGTVGVPPKWRQQCQENSGVASWVFRTFRGSKGKVGFLSRHRCAKGPHIGLRGEFPGVSRVSTGNLGFLSSYDGDLRDPLVGPQEILVSMSVVRNSRIPLQSLTGPRSSSGFQTRTSGFLSSAYMDLQVPLEFPQECQASSRVQTCKSAFLLSWKISVRLHVELT